jgi:hypothetical protein
MALFFKPKLNKKSLTLIQELTLMMMKMMKTKKKIKKVDPPHLHLLNQINLQILINLHLPQNQKHLNPLQNLPNQVNPIIQSLSIKLNVKK